MGKHNIEVTWHQCSQESCAFQAKTKGNLVKHEAAAHDINVKWYVCSFDECSYKAKRSASVKVHFTKEHSDKESEGVGGAVKAASKRAGRTKEKAEKKKKKKKTVERGIGWDEEGVDGFKDSAISSALFAAVGAIATDSSSDSE